LISWGSHPSAALHQRRSTGVRRWRQPFRIRCDAPTNFVDPLGLKPSPGFGGGEGAEGAGEGEGGGHGGGGHGGSAAAAAAASGANAAASHAAAGFGDLAEAIGAKAAGEVIAVGFDAAEGTVLRLEGAQVVIQDMQQLEQVANEAGLSGGPTQPAH